MDFNLNVALRTVPSTPKVLNKKVMCEPEELGKMSFDVQKHNMSSTHQRGYKFPIK